MYETYDNKDTKLLIIQYISIKIILKDHKCIKTNKYNISVNAQSNTLPHPTDKVNVSEKGGWCRVVTKISSCQVNTTRGSHS